MLGTFTNFNPSNLRDDFKMKLSSPLFLTQGSLGPESVKVMPEVAQLVRGRALPGSRVHASGLREGVLMLNCPGPGFWRP